MIPCFPGERGVLVAYILAGSMCGLERGETSRDNDITVYEASETGG
jgi:hypothetical protein